MTWNETENKYKKSKHFPYKSLIKGLSTFDNMILNEKENILYFIATINIREVGERHIVSIDTKQNPWEATIVAKPLNN